MSAAPTASTTTDVVILEPNASGHRFYYVRLLADALLARGRRPVLVTSAGAMATPQAAEFLAGLPAGFRVEEMTDAGLPLASRFAASRAIDSIVVPDGDGHLVPLLTRVGRRLPRVTVLIMREPDLRRGQPLGAWARQLLKLGTMLAARLRPDARVAVLKSSVWSGRSLFPVAWDPVTLNATPDDVTRLREGWALDPGIYWFAVLGAITARKNLPLVAEAFAGIARDGVGLLIGGAVLEGQLDEAEPHLAEARSRGARVVVVDRMLEDVELDAAVGAVDCVVLAHSNEGPSGILGKAVMSGSRLLLSGALSLQRDAAAAPRHATWTPLTATALADGMERAAASPRPEPVPDMGSSRFTGALL